MYSIVRARKRRYVNKCTYSKKAYPHKYRYTKVVVDHELGKKRVMNDVNKYLVHLCNHDNIAKTAVFTCAHLT